MARERVRYPRAVRRSFAVRDARSAFATVTTPTLGGRRDVNVFNDRRIKYLL
jgi:hypothetical protein